MGIAKATANLDRPQDALAVYQQIATPDSQLAQADLLAETDPKQALALDLASPYPAALWNATGILEAQNASRRPCRSTSAPRKATPFSPTTPLIG